MRIHHLSCGTMCPFGGRLWDGRTQVLGPAEIVCHCLLIETEVGLVLVDTGFGTRDVAQPRRLTPFSALPIAFGYASPIPLCGKSKSSGSALPMCATSY